VHGVPLRPVAGAQGAYGRPGDRADSTATSGWRDFAGHPKLRVMTTGAPESAGTGRSLDASRWRALGARAQALQ
jgi:hypothetical protein